MMKSNYSNERRKETLLMMISSNDDVCFRCYFYAFMMFVFVLRRRPSFPSFLRFEVVVVALLARSLFFLEASPPTTVHK